MTAVAPRRALTVYTNPRTRGRIAEWYVKEIGVDAELVNLDMKEREHKAPQYLQVNPFGLVPAIKDDVVNVFESGAVLLYLADKYGPPSTPESRGRAASWALFANSTLANALFEQGPQLPEMMGALDLILSKSEYLEGSFSVAAVAVGACLLYVIAVMLPHMDLAPWPHVVAYMQRLADRPAAQEAMAESIEAFTAKLANKADA